jgi:O-antigen/teichoic acid export membrane protein
MNEFQRILKHSFIYGLGNILSKLIGFILIPVYTNILTPDEYGEIALLQNTMNIIQIIVGLGLAVAFLRFYSEDKSTEARETVISTSMLFTVAFALMVTALGVLFATDISFLVMQNRGYAQPFTVMMFVLLFSSIIEIPLVILRAREKSIVFIMVCLAQLLLGLFFNILFIVILRAGVAGWLLSALWTSVIICSYVVISTLTSVRKIRFSFPLLKRMLVYTLPLIPASLAMFWIHNGDKYILKYYFEIGEVGIYSLGYQFAFMITLLVGQPFFMIWSVRMYDVFEQDGGDRIYARTFTYFAAVILTCWLCLAATIKEVIYMMSPPSYHRAYMIVHIVAMGYVLREFSDFFKGVLLIKRRTSFIGVTTLFSAFVATVFYLLLIPPYGILGAAWATFITFFTMAGCIFLASLRVHRVPWEYKRLTIMGALSISILITFKYISLPTLFANMAVKGALALSFIPLLYLGGFFSDEEKGLITKGLRRALVFLRLRKAST